jgi:hypothetical protein
MLALLSNLTEQLRAFLVASSRRACLPSSKLGLWAATHRSSLPSCTSFSIKSPEARPKQGSFGESTKISSLQASSLVRSRARGV